MSLKAAHSGYLYQDIATAYMLVLALADNHDKVIVDKKQVDDDRIDDLEVIIDGKRIRRQFKSSLNTARTIEESDFIGSNSSLRIDKLVLTQKQETGATYRLCATWAPPLADNAMCGLIEKVSAETTFKDTPNSIYRVIPEKVWPHGQQAIWQPLQANKSITKQDFYDFCNNFLIELELPPASTELNQPGALEKSLFSLLQSRIGIGRYPNHTRRVEDVAALAISLATFARTKEAELTTEQIQAELNIRLDYGYISQTFPIDYSTYLPRKGADDRLKNLALSGGWFILLGAPGSGKSWALTALAEDLKKNGIIVARHYCFIAPDDQNASLRITTNQFYGNLIAELVKAHSNVGHTLNTYAAGLTELEKAINSLTDNGHRVVIIVDGLDHIERVLKNAPNVSQNEAGITEQLSILSLKNELCTIIIGTQPGEHLSILDNSCDKATYFNIDPWSQEDFFNLSIKYDFKNTFLSSGDSTEESYNRILETLYTKSEGNPLYISYILRSIVFALQEESIAEIFERAKEIPPFSGHINSYYSYLYEGVSDFGKFFAELLAVIDFSVSAQDIEEISPLLHGWTDKIIVTLAPVLTITTGQGGIRVFHESFKRFILESLAREGRNSEQPLTSVANWLLAKGFFRDARSFRFLFPIYYQLNKHVEICKLTSPDYVALSVAYVHPVYSILSNITIASKAAAAQNDWPALVRCVELNRALETYDAERRSRSLIFYQANLAVYGTSLLTERLLFEGKPALPRRLGLKLCSLIDSEGGVPPWREYINCPSGSEEHTGRIGNGELNEIEEENLDVLHGAFSLNSPKAFRVAVDELKSASRTIYLKNLCNLLIKFKGITYAVRLSKHLIRKKVSKRTIFYVLSSIADAYLKNHDKTKAQIISNIATWYISSPAEISACTKQNASATLLARFARPFVGLKLGFGKGFIGKDDDIYLWIALVKLHARLGHKHTLEKEKNKFTEEGWYSCWLKSVISLALASEADDAEEKKEYFAQAIQDIIADTEPFSGSPRATDLYEIRGLLENSFYEFLSLATTRDDFESTLRALKKVSDDTAATLFRSDSGPLPYPLFLSLLLRYIRNKSQFSEQATDFIFEITSASDEHYRAYEQHAEYYSYLAIALASIGKADEAAEKLKIAATLLTSYGYHKDINLFDLIDSVSAFSSHKKREAKYSLKAIKPLIDAALFHSDERTTNHLYNSWINAIAEINLPYAFFFLHKNIIKNAYLLNWMTSEAIYDLLKLSKGITHPLLALSLYMILDHSNDEKERSSNNDIIISSIKELKSGYIDIYEDIRLKKELHYSSKNTKGAPSNPPSGLSFRESIKKLSHEPIVFPPNARHVEIIATLQKISKLWNNDLGTQEYLITYLSYVLECYCISNAPDHAMEIIYFLARKMTFYDSGKHPLYTLGQALESVGLKDLAVHAYVLSFIYSRGRGGWMSIGDTRHGASLLRAQGLDPELTEKVLAQEIAHRLSGLGYTGEMVKSVIVHLGLLLGADTACNAWNAAFEVEQGRLSLAPTSSSFENVNFEEFPNLCLDEAIILIILTLLSEPDLRLKNSALFWLAKIIKFTPSTFAAAFNIWASECNLASSVLIVLDLLANSKLDKSIKEVLAANYDNIVKKKLYCATKILDAICVSNAIQTPSNCSDKFFDINTVIHIEPSRGFRLMLELAIEIGLSKESLEIVRKIYQTRFTEQAEEIMQACYKMFGGRDFDSIPKSPVLLYEHELLFESMNLVFSNPNITHALTSDEALINKLTPDVVGHLHVEASSETRPTYPTTTELLDGAFELQPIIASADEQFLGWIRIGYIEAYYFAEAGRHFKRVVFAGALSRNAANTRPSQVPPFYHIGNSRICWDSEQLYGVQKDTTRSGILVGLAIINDWLGHEVLLIPPTHIFRPKLRFPKVGEPLIWQDDNGPAFSMKRWRTHKRGYTGEYPIDITGAELLARPDIVERLQVYYGQNIRLYQIAQDIPVEENEVYPFKKLLR